METKFKLIPLNLEDCQLLQVTGISRCVLCCFYDEKCLREYNCCIDPITNKYIPLEDRGLGDDYFEHYWIQE